MIDYETQELRQLLDDRAQSYSPDRVRITARVASGRSPKPRMASGGAVLAAAAAVFVCAGVVWVLRSADGPEVIATVSDDRVTPEVGEPSPQVDPDTGQTGTEDRFIVEAGETTTTSTADRSPTTDGSDPNGDPTPTTPVSTTATPTTDGSDPNGDPTPTTPVSTTTPTTTITTTTTSVASTLDTTPEVETTTTTTPAVVVDAPDSCYVQTDGIEVFDSAFEFAESYAFFDADGRFVLSTSSLGPADDIEDEERSIEWTVETYGYEHAQVYSAAAEEPGGGRSEPVVCRRHVLLD